MPAKESARARAERLQRAKQREMDAQVKAQQLQEEAQGDGQGQDQDQGQGQGQQQGEEEGAANDLADEDLINLKREDSVEFPMSESPVAKKPMRSRNRTRVTDRTRKPMNKYKEEKFDREIRWMFFLNLRHENDGTKDAVIGAIEPQLDPMSYAYEDLWRFIMNRVNHLRGSTIQYLKTHVQDMLKLDEANNGRLATLQTHAELAAYFQGIYSMSKFFDVFYFAQPIVDLREPSPLALYYVKSLYANACAKTKLHLDWAATEIAFTRAVELKKRLERDAAATERKVAAENYEDVAVAEDEILGDGDVNAGVNTGTDGLSINNGLEGPATGAAPAAVASTGPSADDIVIPPFDKLSPHNREGLTVYLNNFPLAPQFDKVTRREFKEKLAKRVKKPKSEPTHVAVGLDNMFFDGEPPKPSAR